MKWSSYFRWNANRLMSRKMSSLTGVHQWDSSTSKIIGYMAEADGEKLNSTKSLLPLASSIRKVFIIINEVTDFEWEQIFRNKQSLIGGRLALVGGRLTLFGNSSDFSSCII